jgi:serine phosphatase RsbU (regulator of sigma subunit)
MTRQRWLILFLLAFIGYGTLWWLYPRTSPAAAWNYQFNRKQAIERARAVAQQFGVNTTGWYVKIKTNRIRGTVAYYLRQQPAPLVTQLFTPLTTDVSFSAPGEAESVTVKLSAQGRPYSFVRQKRNERNPEQNPEQTAESQPIGSAEQALAEKALQQLLGAEASLFAPTGQPTRERGRVKHTLTATLANETRVKLLADVTTKDNETREAALNTEFTDAFQREVDALQSRTLQLLNNANATVLIPLAILCLMIYFFGWGQGELLHRQALYCFALVFLFTWVTSYFGAFSAELGMDIPIANPLGAAIARTALFTLVIFFMTLPLYAFWASGHSLLARQEQRRTTAFELLLKGKLHTRYFGEHVAAGILLGGLAATLPFVLRQLPAFQTTSFSVRDTYSLFTAICPTLGSLSEDHLYGAFIFFAFAVPLIETYVPRAALSGGLILLLGTLWFAGDGYFGNSAPAALLLGFGLSLLYYAAYRRFDFLTVLVAALSSIAVLNALALRAQPAASLQGAGRNLLVGLAVLLLASLVVAWRGREVSQEVFAPLLQAARGAERERLKADLEVASRAQQQMLPGEPPHLPGYDIAAICTPSKDVGGDLYDFINLPDGRLGIVVADVSGKGVPAALYMTLTKGLLASVAEEQSDPGNILREVNRHLYEACRKKVFVTLFLGVLDPATRTLTYARAGHNPTVWRSPVRNATELLRPAGMGLGLNQGKIFNTTLKVASLQLEANDALFFYSDGITEAMNAKQEEYGEERLMALAAQTDKLNAGAALNAIMADVKAFLGSIAPQDDQTLVVVKVS